MFFIPHFPVILNENNQTQEINLNKISNLNKNLQKNIEEKKSLLNKFNSTDLIDESLLMTNNNSTSNETMELLIGNSSTKMGFNNRINNIDKLIQLKILIKLIEVIGILIILTTSVISIHENEIFYNSNVRNRIFGTLLINSIIYNISSIDNNNFYSNEYDDMLNITNYYYEDNIDVVNSTNTTNNTNNSTNSKITCKNYNYYNNYNNTKYSDEIYYCNKKIVNNLLKPRNLSLILHYKGTEDENIYDLREYKYVSNGEIINSFDLTKFGIGKNSISFNNIKIPLEISNKSNQLRMILLILSLISAGLSFISNYISYIREYIYKQERKIKFYKTEFFLFAFIESIYLLIFQYQNLTGYIVFSQLGYTVIVPYSSILTSICLFRFFYIFKLVTIFSKLNDTKSEIIINQNNTKAGFVFLFKSIQKEQPFLVLFLILLLTCLCFGFSIRIFELYYWETQENKLQDWNYQWNAVWLIFVSMTTVGYGDFYPKTHLGRILLVVSCFIGVYFVSMMMRFMSRRSILNDSELKAFNLITRLKLRKEVKSIQSMMVYHCLMMKLHKQNMMVYNGNVKENKHEISYGYERRCVINLIRKNKNKAIRIKSFNYIPTKEQLFDVCERIDQDIKEILSQIELLNMINKDFIEYADRQMEILSHTKKNIYANKMLYKIINLNKNQFEILSQLNFQSEIYDDENKFKADFNFCKEREKERERERDKKEENDLILNFQLEPDDIKTFFYELMSGKNETWKRKSEYDYIKIMNEYVNEESVDDVNFKAYPYKYSKNENERNINNYKNDENENNTVNDLNDKNFNVEIVDYAKSNFEIN